MFVEIYFAYLKHVAPLGLNCILILVFYKHFALLGLFILWNIKFYKLVAPLFAIISLKLKKR